MTQGTELGLMDVYRRLGALEESDRSTKASMSELRSTMRRIERAQADQAVQMHAQAESVQEINAKLAFVDKLEVFLMKVEVLGSTAAKIGKYAATGAKVLLVVSILATAYASGGLDGVIASLGNVLTVLGGA